MTNSELKRKNIRIALMLGLFALIVFATSFPFWSGLFKIAGSSTL